MAFDTGLHETYQLLRLLDGDELDGLADTSLARELVRAMRKARENRELQLYALMVTDVLTKGTDLLVDGDVAGVARAFGLTAHDSQIELPGVMSRKKEVAPKLLAAM